MRKIAVLSALAATILLVPSSADAFVAGRPTGVVITVDATTATDATLGVQMTTTGTSPLGTIGSPVGFFGNLWSFQYTFFGSTVTNRYVWLYPSAPAFDFGDSSTIDATTLSLAAAGPPNVYQGSFMHTYPATGSYTVTAGVCRFIGPTATVTPPAPGYGNLATVGTGTSISFLRYLLPTFTVPTTIVGNFITPYAVGITNTIGVTLADPTPLIEVPTAGTAGLLTLALLLGITGLLWLRR